MATSAYDGAQTATDILLGYNRYLRDELVNMTNAEIHELIKKFETCADSTHGPDRHHAVERLIKICREELDDRDLVRCLVEAGLVIGIDSVGGDTVE
jgi:hypothetical protein